MADNPRLTIELLDRSGSQGAASTNPNQPGAANVPGSDIASDFQKRVSELGAGSSSPSQSTQTPLPSDTLGTALDNQARQNTPSSGYQGIQPANAHLGNLVNGLYNADPNVSAPEIQGLLGISKETATDLLNAARARQAEDNRPSTTPTPIPPPSSTPSPATGRPYQTDNDEYRLEPEPDEEYRLRNTPDAYGASPAPPVTPTYNSYQIDPASDDMLPPVFNYPKPPIPEIIDAEAVEGVSGRQTANVINSAINALGLGGTRLGNVAQTAISTAGSLIPEAGGVGASLLAAAPAVAAVGGALAVATGTYYALDNEAQRAVALSRGYSADVAGAEARAEVNQIMANMRTARRLGDEAADYIENSSSLSSSFQNIRDVISEPALQSFNKNMRGLSVIMDQFSKLADQAPNNDARDKNLSGGIEAINAYGDIGRNQMKYGTIFGGIKSTLELLSYFKADKPKENFEGWFDMLVPHLPPPPPFDAGNNNDKPLGVQFAPIPGLNF